MYKAIRKHPTTSEIYAKKLVSENVVTEGEVEKMRRGLARAARCRTRGEPGLQGQQRRLARRPLGRHQGGARRRRSAPRPYRRAARDAQADRAEITSIPQGFHAHRTIQRFLENRRKAIETGEGIDWSTAEALAFCSLMLEGPSGAAVRPGYRARHVLAASFGADRPGERGPLRPVQSPGRAPGPFRGHQFDAVGGGGASASNTAIRSPNRMRSRCGRRSSAISPTAPRSCSTSSSLRASASGCACPASSACCRTATRGRGRNIPRQGSSAFCRCAPRTICRSRTAPRRPTTSTSCAGSSSATSASRSS